MQLEGPLVRGESNGLAYTCAYSLNNVGRSPAFKVMFTVAMMPLADPKATGPASDSFSYPEPVAALRRTIAQTC